MPELPSVELFKRFFEDNSLYQTIIDVQVSSPEILFNIKKDAFQEALIGEKFDSSYRYGKYLFSSFKGNQDLVIHFGMTGFLRYYSKEDNHHKHDRISFIFDNGRILSFNDPRKFGKVGIASPRDLIREKKLGPDALHLDYPLFKKLFHNRKGTLKPLLLNQKFIAGIGNLYADEILYQSKLHPLEKANHLQENNLKNLHENMVKVLKKAIDCKDSLSNFPQEYLLAHRYPQGECPHGEKLEIIKVGGRTTYYCPHRQKLFK